MSDPERCRVRQEEDRLVVAVDEMHLVLPDYDGVGRYAVTGKREVHVVLPIDR